MNDAANFLYGGLAMAQTSTQSLEDVFDRLTSKQRQAIELLADGWTSKEMATQLGISESATVQRIETLRAKAGGVLRKDLARLYREYRETHDADCKEITGKNFQLPQWVERAEKVSGTTSQPDLTFSDALTFESMPPWSEAVEPRVVPEVLEGKNASLNRWLAAVGLAVGMVILMLVLLAVAGQISELF